MLLEKRKRKNRGRSSGERDEIYFKIPPNKIKTPSFWQITKIRQH